MAERREERNSLGGGQEKHLIKSTINSIGFSSLRINGTRREASTFQVSRLDPKTPQQTRHCFVLSSPTPKRIRKRLNKTIDRCFPFVWDTWIRDPIWESSCAGDMYAVGGPSAGSLEIDHAHGFTCVFVCLKGARVCVRQGFCHQHRFCVDVPHTQHNGR